MVRSLPVESAHALFRISRGHADAVENAGNSAQRVIRMIEWGRFLGGLVRRWDVTSRIARSTRQDVAPLSKTIYPRAERGPRSPSHALVYNRRQSRSESFSGEEVRVVTEQVVVCPNCRYEIKLTEAISAPIVERLRKQFEADARKKGEELARREQALTEKTAEIEKAKETIDAQVAERLKAERRRVAKEEARKASEALATEMTDLRQQLDDKASKLDEAQKNELELRKQRRDLEERKKQMQLEIERKLDTERKAIRESTQKDMAEEHRLKEAEKEQQLTAMRKQIDDLKRKAEQGSQQTQGEVLELELEALLATRFPTDTIEPVPKGVHGSDVLQRVHDGNGNACGTIIWESKRTKAWSNGWLPKLRDDQREAKAELAAIVSVALPADLSTFALIDGVWVTSGACVAGLAAALRMSLIEMNATRQAEHGRQSKMEVLYAYLAGPQFRQRVEAIFESFSALRNDLEQEKRAMQRIWAKREKQIDRVLANTVGLHGDVAGIIGGTLPEIAGIELKALAAEAPYSDYMDPREDQSWSAKESLRLTSPTCAQFWINKAGSMPLLTSRMAYILSLVTSTIPWPIACAHSHRSFS